MSKNIDIVEIINNNFRDISSINISELSLAVASPSRKAIEHRYFQMECVHDNENKKFFLKVVSLCFTYFLPTTMSLLRT